MDFKQVDAFVNVARCKSFSKAAEVMYLSQPTISTHISSLENEIGISLFDRSGREVQLTPVGALFYDYAVNMLNTRQEALNAIAEFYSRIQGELSIASSTTPCRYILPELIMKFSSKYPEVTFKISEISSNDVIDRILHFDAEIGLVGRKYFDEKLVFTEIAKDNLVLVTPVNNKFKNISENALSFEYIKDEQFVLRDKSSATRQVFETVLSSAGYNPENLKVFSEVSSMEAALQFVKHGLGVTVISENAAREYIKAGLIKRFYIKDLHLNRSIYIVKHGRRTLSPAAKLFEDLSLKEK